MSRITSKTIKIEKFITEGNEKADDRATEGAMLDGGVVATDQSQHSPAEKRGGVRSTAIRSKLSLECVYTLPVPQDRMRSCKSTALSNQQTVSPETPDVHVQMTMTNMGISFQGTKRARLMSHVSMEGGAMFNLKNT